MSVMLLEGCLICYLNFLLDQSSFVQVQIAAGKHVFPFEQQLSGLFLLRFRPLLEALEVQCLQNPSLLGIAFGFPGSPCQENHWLDLVGRDDLDNHSLSGDFLWNGCLSCAGR